VLCRIEEPPSSRARLEAQPRVSVSGICLPKAGEEQAGDGWHSVSTRDTTTILVADGLGHGPAAATASAAAVRMFAERPDLPLENIIHDAHAALRPTRGAALGIARIYASARRVEFGGVGNIAGAIVSPEGVRRTVSHNGIVGHEMRKVQTFSYPWTNSSVLVLHSDGVSASWSLAGYPGLEQRDATMVAAMLYRDYCRGNDDATVVVAKAS
jgi:hypothetical protein